MAHKQGTVAAGHTTLRKLPHDDHQFKACLGLNETLLPVAAQKGDTQVTRPGGSTQRLPQQSRVSPFTSQSLGFPSLLCNPLLAPG